MIIEKGDCCPRRHLAVAIEEIQRQSNSLDIGSIYEFGILNGLSLRIIIDHLDKAGLTSSQIFGIDSFLGLPEESPDVERDPNFRIGDFKGNIDNCQIPGVTLVIKSFKDLTEKDIKIYNMKPARLVHIDCDLYISALEALEFMFSNKLIDTNTILAYDEFKSSFQEFTNGESWAHKQISEKYLVEFEELYRFVAHDLWQNCFRIKSIGSVSKLL